MKVDVLETLEGLMMSFQLLNSSVGASACKDVKTLVAELIAADEEFDRIRNRMYLLLLADPRRDALEEELKVCSARRAAALLACKSQDHER